MNCKNCTYYILDIQERNDFRGDPFKHTCELNGFKSLSSTNNNGASLSINSTIYYSENQFESFVKNYKWNICWRKLFKNNIFSLVIAAIALIISCYTAFFKPDNNDNKINQKQITTEIINTIDSLQVNSKISNNENAINDLKLTMTIQDSIIQINSKRISELE